MYSFKKVFVGRGRGGYIHPKFIRDRKELCNTIKLCIKASRRTSCRDYSALFRSPNAFRSLDDKNSATLPNVGCDDELWRPRNIPSEMSHSFTPIMRKSPPISPSLCRQKKIASIEMKEASSSSLDLLQHFTGQQQVEQQIGSSLLVASIADHSANSSACDVDTWYHPMAPTRFRAALNEHDFNNQTNTISFADYDRMFHKPLSDDLEPKHFPSSNVMIAERHTIGLGVVDHRLTPPIILGHDICFDVKVGFDIPSMSPDTSMAKMYPPIHLDSNSYPRHH